MGCFSDKNVNVDETSKENKDPNIINNEEEDRNKELEKIRKEQELKDQKEKEELEKIRKDQELKELKEKEQLEKIRKEQEQKDNEEKERLIREQKEKEEKERIIREQQEKEQKEKEEKERLEREKKEKEEKERLEEEQKEKEEKERLEREKKEKEEKERLEREKKEKEEKERLEREKKEKEEKERLEKEQKEKEEKERIEREKKEKEEKERLEKEKKEKEEKEKSTNVDEDTGNEEESHNSNIPSDPGKYLEINLTVKKNKISVPNAKDLERFRRDGLKRHNYYRKYHQAGPMELTQKLNDFAQKYAETLATKDTMQHSTHKEREKIYGDWTGENLYYCWSSESNFPINGAKAVDSWYDEINDYDFKKGKSKNGGVVGHFTQLVWKDSTQLGIGVAKSSKNSIYVVANYHPGGNFNNNELNNVFPASSEAYKEPEKKG